jgi:outer membrane protein assembly factor BamB
MFLLSKISNVKAMSMSKGCFVATVIICVIIFFGLVLVPLANADWSTYRSGPSRTGVGTGGPVLTPNILWKTNVSSPSVKVGTQTFEGERTFTTPVVLHGIIYACSTSSVRINESNYAEWLDVYAFNATNGAEIWDHKISDVMKTGVPAVSVPAVSGNMVYFGANNGQVYALNARNGNLQWNTNVGNQGGDSSPVIVDGILYIGGYNGVVYALNAANGETIWKSTAGTNVGASSPAVVNGVVYLGSNEYNTNGWVEPSAAVDNGVVYAPSNDDDIYALNATNGDLIWKFDTLPPDYVSQEQYGVVALPFPVACDNGMVYVTSDLIIPRLDRGQTLAYALNATTGILIWNFTVTASSNYMSPPAVADGIFYMNIYDGLLALDAENGAIIWNYTTTVNDPWSSDPIVDNGAIFVGSSDGQVYALGSAPPIYPPYNPALPPFQAASTAITIALSIFVISTITVIVLTRLRKSKPKVNLLTAKQELATNERKIRRKNYVLNAQT